jgi:hypothetical protein
VSPQVVTRPCPCISGQFVLDHAWRAGSALDATHSALHGKPAIGHFPTRLDRAGTEEASSSRQLFRYHDSRGHEGMNGALVVEGSGLLEDAARATVVIERF